MKDQQFLMKIAQIGGISGPVTDDSPIAPSEWDSVEVLDLIAAIDDAYGVTVPIASIKSCRTVGELRGLIHQAVVANA